MNFLIYVVCFFSLSYRIICADPNYDPLLLCPCDLYKNLCDINCCCDADCSDDDRHVFSTCNDQQISYTTPKCIQEHLMFRYNTRYTVESTDNGLLCIYFNNYAKSTHYNTVQPISSTSDYQSYKKHFPKYSFLTKSSTPEFGHFDHYKSGDPVLVLYLKSKVLGYLSQPVDAASSHVCVSGNPVAYLRSHTTSCLQPIDRLSTECSKNPSLMATSYYKDFKVIQNSEVFTPWFGNQTHNLTEYGELVLKWYKDWMVNKNSPPEGPLLSALEDSPFVVKVTVDMAGSVCTGRDGVTGKCLSAETELPSPEWVTDAKDPNAPYCKNIVTKVVYNITWNNKQGIIGVNVSFTLSSLSEKKLPFVQTFQTNFVQGNAGVMKVPFSGNPGYIVGHPLRAGRLEAVDDKFAINQGGMLTMLSAGSDGNCLGTNSDAKIRFGINMRSGCFVRLSLEDLAQMCDHARAAAYVALRGANLVTHIATFGNSDPHNVGDWVEIIGVKDDLQKASTTNSNMPGTCFKLLVGLNIEFIYTSVGSVELPQARIIGARFNYVYSDVTMLCIGPYCHPSTQGLTQQFEVVSSVTFIDATTLASGVEAAHPQPRPGLPRDFVNPFYVDSETSA